MSRRATRPPRDVLELFVLAPDPASESAALLASFRNARVVLPFPRRGGEAGARWQRIIRAHERMLAFFDGRVPALPPAAERRVLGRDLFDALFPGEVRRLFDVARSLQDGVLDVVLTSMLDWVADKPWELLWDPSRREALASSGVNFTRNVFTAVPADRPAPRARRLRVLVVAPRPRNVRPVSSTAETRGLREAFRPLSRARLATVELLARPTAAALQRRLAEGGVDVLHFVGHGAFDERARSGSLLLEDDRGGARSLDFLALREIVARRRLRLVFLNACETGRGGRVEWNRGVAPALVAAGLPAVVANQYPVLDTAATSFAREFYGALARGRALGDAAREARVAVSRDAGATGLDWAVPVLFARDPRETLR